MTMNQTVLGGAEIGYILKGYLRTSETFITNEICLLERRGLKLAIFSLLRLEGERRHAVADAIRAPAVYLPPLSPLGEESLLRWLGRNAPPFLESHWRVCQSRPGAYLGALSDALRSSFKHRVGLKPRAVFIKEFLQAGYIAGAVLDAGGIRHLHAHFCHTATSVALCAGRMCGLPVSFTAHAKDIYLRELNPGDLLPSKLRRAQFVVTCTGANAAHLKAVCPEGAPIHTIYHGLDTRQFARTEMTDRERARPLVLAVGRFVEKKGFTYLVEACRLLRDRGHEFECRIVGGGGAYFEQVKARIAELGLGGTVLLCPAVTQEELREIYQEATLFALPCQVVENGDRDGIPNVLVEAMAMGLPVVSTDISGIPELIDRGVNGLLAPQRDAAALAGAIETLLRDAGLRHKLGRAAREKVERHFDAEENVVRLEALFRASLDGAGPGL